MKIYQIKERFILNEDLETIWDFFSNPMNLKIITPEFLNFKFISGAEDGRIYPGKIIEYRVYPLLGIPMQWVTEITQVKDREYFIDEQRFGPYKFWHHQHSFRKTDQGLVVEDLVHYGMPCGIFGQIARELLVKNQLKNIFDYRYQKMKELFKVLDYQNIT